MKNFYTASYLVKYIKCNHIISNDFNEKNLKLKRNIRTVADDEDSETSDNDNN